MFSIRYIFGVYKQKQTKLLQIVIFYSVTKYQYCNMLLNHGSPSANAQS